MSFPDASHGFIEGAGTGSGLLATSNGGADWSVLKAPASSTVSFVTSTTGWVAGSSIYQTQNSGGQWTKQTLPAWRYGFSDLDALDSSHAWAAGMLQQPPTPTGAILFYAGSSWAAQSLPAGVTSVNALEFSSTTIGVALGMDSSNKPVILQTSNGGNTWNLAAAPTGVSVLNAVAGRGSDFWAVGYGVTGSAQYAVVLASRDGGATWASETPPASFLNIYDVSFSDALNGYAVGSDGNQSQLLTTANGGQSWQATSPVSEVGSLGWSGVRALSPTQVWIAGANACYRPLVASNAPSAGASWIVQLSMAPSLDAAQQVSFPTNAAGWAIGADSCGAALLRTTNGGKLWTGTSGPPGNRYSAIDFLTAGTGLVAASDQSGAAIYRTTSSGSSWVKSSSPPTMSDIGRLSFGDSMHGFALTGSGVLATTDGGSTWSQKALPAFTGTLQDISAVGQVDAWIVGASNSSGFILATQDGGTTWKQESLPSTPSPVAGLSGVSFVDASHGWAVGQTYGSSVGLVLQTTDGGTTWTEAATLSNTYGLNQVRFASSTVGWAVGSLQGPNPQTGVFGTTDGGVTWTQEVLPPGINYFEQLTSLGTSRLWGVGQTSQGGVYGAGFISSTNGGTTWTNESYSYPEAISVTPTSGLPGVTVTVNGRGVRPNEKVYIRWQTTGGALLATATSDGTGSFSTTATVPATATMGSYKIYAVGQVDLATASAAFKVT